MGVCSGARGPGDSGAGGVTHLVVLPPWRMRRRGSRSRRGHAAHLAYRGHLSEEGRDLRWLRPDSGGTAPPLPGLRGEKRISCRGREEPHGGRLGWGRAGVNSSAPEGRSYFLFSPGSLRTPWPCFLGSPGSSPSLISESLISESLREWLASQWNPLEHLSFCPLLL